MYFCLGVNKVLVLVLVLVLAERHTDFLYVARK